MVSNRIHSLSDVEPLGDWGPLSPAITLLARLAAATTETEVDAIRDDLFDMEMAALLAADNIAFDTLLVELREDDARLVTWLSEMVADDARQRAATTDDT